MTTTFDYDVPRRLGGRMVDRLLLEKRMRHDFEDSMDNLRLLAETSAVPAVGDRGLTRGAPVPGLPHIRTAPAISL